MAIPRTTVQFIDKTDHAGHVSQEVRINDVPVLVADDGVFLDFSAHEITRLRLDLLPSQITFSHEKDA